MQLYFILIKEVIMQPDDEYPCKRQELHLICIFDTCYDTITEFVSKIVTKHSANLHPQSGWKSVIQLLSLCGRHPETKDQAVNVLIGLMSTNDTR